MSTIDKELTQNLGVQLKANRTTGGGYTHGALTNYGCRQEPNNQQIKDHKGDTVMSSVFLLVTGSLDLDKDANKNKYTLPDGTTPGLLQWEGILGIYNDIDHWELYF